jgi:hypothetical protein
MESEVSFWNVYFWQNKLNVYPKYKSETSTNSLSAWQVSLDFIVRLVGSMNYTVKLRELEK